jgi:hypothetical protein
MNGDEQPALGMTTVYWQRLFAALPQAPSLRYAPVGMTALLIWEGRRQ